MTRYEKLFQEVTGQSYESHLRDLVEAECFIQVSPLSKGGFRERVVKPSIFDAPQVPEDYCLCDDYPPGSPERIQALAEWYSTEGENSPFVMTIDEEINELTKPAVMVELDKAIKKEMAKG